MKNYREWCEDKNTKRPYATYYEEYERGFLEGSAQAKHESLLLRTATSCLPPLFKGGKQEGTDAQFAARSVATATDLLPCPICNEQVRFIDYTPEWGVEYFEIECTNLICTTSLKSKNAENLINVWNKMAR